MSRDNEIEVFKTADLPLAAALSVFGFIVEKVERVDSRRSVFIFNNSDELQEAVSNYWKGGMLIEPQKYFNQLKTLKARIYENGNQSRGY